MVRFSGLPDPLEPRTLRERALPLVLLFAFALALRVAAVWIGAGLDARPEGAAVAIEQAAWNLADGRGLSIGEGQGHAPTAAVSPLTPWLASFVYRTLGREYFAALLAQAALAAFVPLLVARLGAPLFGGAIGFAAGVMAAADPVLLGAARSIGGGSVFACALLWAAIVSVEWVRGPTRRRALWAGIASGVAALAHPAALALPPVTLAWAWVPLGLVLEPRAARRQMLILAAGFTGVILPWMWRNLLVTGAFTPATGGAPPAGAADAGGAGTWLAWWALLLPPAAWGAARVLSGARRMFQSYPLGVIGILAASAMALRGSFDVGPSIEPFAVLFAAAGASDLWRRWRTRRLRVVP